MKKVLVPILCICILSLCFCFVSCGGQTEYNINFIVDDEVYNTIVTDGKSVIEMPTDPTKVRCTFDGWFYDNGTWEKSFTANSLLDAPLSANLSVYAKFTTHIHTYVEDVTPPTCTEGYTTHTCACGHSYVDTYTTGIVAHSYENDICTQCHKTRWVKYTLSADKRYYIVSADETPDGTVDLTIPATFNGKPVQVIAEKGFSDAYWITSISLPNSIETIGTRAFYNCTSLTTVTFEANSQCTSIGHGAFRDCTNLTGITIPSCVTTIGDVAFYNCRSLTSITIPSSVTSIGEKAFIECTGLTTVTFEANSQCTSIGNSAFSDCTGLTSITIPSSVTSIGERAFCNCSSLTSITIPSSVTSIGSWAFYDCNKLVQIRNFSQCTLSDLPTNVEQEIKRDNTPFTNTLSIGEKYITYTVGNKVYLMGATNSNEVTSASDIPSNVTDIYQYAFAYCTGLTTVTFEANSQCTSIGDYAFEGCTSLTSITIPSSVTSIGYNAFFYCPNLTSVVFENTVGWVAGDTAISSTDLSNSSTAAKYLKDIYCYYQWTRS